MRKRIKYTIATAALTAVLVGGGAASAFAIGTPTNFDGVANRGQQSRYFEYQTKTLVQTSGIHFNTIGNGYTMNVKAQNGATNTQYTERKGLGTGYDYGITNSTPVGTQTRLIVTNNTFSTVTVAITGFYRTN